MKIKITREDIRKAKEERRKMESNEIWCYSRSETCPLAFALKRMFPGVHVVVSCWRIYFGKQDIDLDAPIAAFIAEADKKKDKIRPRELEIPIE